MSESHLHRVDPPFWWCGMKHSQLMLMFHGEGIAEFEPKIEYSGVCIKQVVRKTNRNYLFVFLEIGSNAPPGALIFRFSKDDDFFDYAYRLKARHAGSSQRIGFNSSDVILNLMPDRFSRGRMAISEPPGMLEANDRADIDSGRHGGDIQGIINHLDYFSDMGFTAIWLTPLVENNQPMYSYHGYAVTDSYAVDGRFGNNDDYADLVRQAREKGMGVIIDVVFNHIGSHHWWMSDMPMKDWISFGGEYVQTLHAHASVVSPYAAEVDKVNYVSGWFDKNMPDVNVSNPCAGLYQIQNAIWWVEFSGACGIRADTFSYADKSFVREWTRRIMAEYPNFNIVGEVWSDNPVLLSYWLRGKENMDGYATELPSVMDYPLSSVLRSALLEEDTSISGLARLYEVLSYDVLYPDPANLVVFEGNHDISRIFSSLEEDLDLYKMAIAYLLTIRGIPQMYYGTEVLMTSPIFRSDGKFRQNFPGGWQGDPVNAVTGEGLSRRQLAAQQFVKKLLNWRKTKTVVHQGKLLQFVPDNGVFVYFRYSDSMTVMVVMNKSRGEQNLQTSRFSEVLRPCSTGCDVITGTNYDLSTCLAVPARSVLVMDVTESLVQNNHQ
jgi:glycosidase